MVICPLGFLLISPLLRYIIGVIHVAIGFSSIFGNTLILCVIYKTQTLRTCSNLILGSLAMTDLLNGLLTEPMSFLPLFSKMVRGNCEFNSLRRNISSYLGVVTSTLIGLISYDRFVHLSKMNDYSNYMSLRKVIFLIILCWILPVAMPMIQLIKDGTGTVYSFTVSTYLLLNFGVVMISYVSIMKKIKASKSRLLQHSSDAQRSRATRKLVRSAKTILLLVVCFGLTTLPIAIYFGISFFQRMTLIHLMTKVESEITYTITMTFAQLNSGINPIIYYVKIPEFKAQIKRWLPGSQIQPSTSKEKDQNGGNPLSMEHACAH